jgi:hypothetical protein
MDDYAQRAAAVMPAVSLTTGINSTALCKSSDVAAIRLGIQIRFLIFVYISLPHPRADVPQASNAPPAGPHGGILAAAAKSKTYRFDSAKRYLPVAPLSVRPDLTGCSHGHHCDRAHR